MKRITLLPVLGLVLLISCSENNKAPRGSGLIEASDITFSVEATGQLVALYRDEGARVAVGDTLALIDTATVMVRLRQARAAAEAAGTQIDVAAIGVKQAESNLEQANTEFERMATLIQTGSVNKQQYDRAKTAFDQAKLAREQAEASRRAAEAQLTNAVAQVDLLEDLANDHFPISPVGGVVVERFVDLGELAAAGRPLVRIARLDTVWVKIYLPPSDLARVAIGGHAIVDPETGAGNRLDGAITWISSQPS